ncbi:unnamed protein product [Dovyalis caffra]|uniref:Bifunctional inhibitor/plant lipid transfer protein/seed storage helical domain-containing protein n=1 Tax=Dovyalis caffra TaxID=77055 RepID=A0AAV1S537_9ROSI|nr:unnamed protein product [Dovyalis caffra]
MASSGIRMGLVLVLMAIISGGAMAQSSCSNAIMSLSPCLNYITGNSTGPSSSCCSQLGNVVQTSPLCLCSLLNNTGASLGITINRTLALNLPGACKVQTPPINQCKAATAPSASASPPVTSPASSPADSPDQTPEPDITPSASDIPSASGTGNGSKTVPSTTGTSDGTANSPAALPASPPVLSPPADSSDATPESPTTLSTPGIPAGSGSKTVPTSTGTSDASIMRLQLHLAVHYKAGVQLGFSPTSAFDLYVIDSAMKSNAKLNKPERDT